MSQALVDALTALIDSRIAAHAGATPSVTPTPAPTPTVDPLAGLTAASVQQVQVTPQMIQELVMQMVEDANKKAKIIAAMQAMGISELPAARPDQLPELYQRLTAIKAEAGGTPAPTASAPSII